MLDGPTARSLRHEFEKKAEQFHAVLDRRLEEAGFDLHAAPTRYRRTSYAPMRK